MAWYLFSHQPYRLLLMLIFADSAVTQDYTSAKLPQPQYRFQTPADLSIPCGTTDLMHVPGTEYASAVEEASTKSLPECPSTVAGKSLPHVPDMICLTKLGTYTIDTSNTSANTALCNQSSADINVPHLPQHAPQNRDYHTSSAIRSQR